MAQDIYTTTSYEINKLVTHKYSTSFSLAIKAVNEPVRTHIYNIYGLVRVTDELVDTLRPKESAVILKNFIDDTNRAVDVGVSLNPIIHAYAQTAREFDLPPELLKAFFISMQMDISKKTYSSEEYKEYIYGSAEVIGLMCLMVFVGGNKELYKKLKPSAQVLGSAFQKVNFLRDINIDNSELGRMYFPDIKLANLTNDQKKSIEQEIAIEFKKAQKAIAQLPYSSKYGVLLALWYYQNLLAKISRTDVTIIKKNRIRISNYKKLILLAAVLSRKLLHI